MSPQENTNSVHRWQEGSQSSQPLHPHGQTQRQGSTEKCFAVVWQGQPCQNSSYQMWHCRECSAQGTRVGSGGKGEVGQCSAPCRAPDLPANQEPQQCRQRGFFPSLCKTSQCLMAEQNSLFTSPEDMLPNHLFLGK